MPSPAPSNVGFMGQECITCHNGHPSGTDSANAGVVRAPDPAGVRSATGLSKANDSICEDCHNWQYETQGLATPGDAGFNYAPVANLAGHSPSHPQRETLHGRSMVEIPQASEFMPNVKCEDCHMPKTNSEANRISHGMKPMLPGDAKTWNAAANAASVAAGKAPVYEGKDSCTKCHPGLTADQLQAKVNDGQGGGWQNVAKDEAAKVATAITAAQTASEFSMTDSSKPGYVLVGRATWNYMVWQQDSSGSVHNPPYVMAGLQKAEQLAMSVGGKFAFFGGSASILPGGTGFVSGKVVNGDGSGAAGAMIKLSTGVTTTADALGGFTFIVTQDVATSYTAT
jgi:Cytochrome c552.